MSIYNPARKRGEACDGLFISSKYDGGVERSKFPQPAVTSVWRVIARDMHADYIIIYIHVS